MSDEITAQDLMAAYGIAVEEQAEAEHRGVLVVAECLGGEVNPASLAALGVGRDIADALGARLEALLLGGGEEQAAALIRRGADGVVIADAPPQFDAAAWSEVLASGVESRKPEVVLLGAGDAAGEIGPRAAQRLDTGLIAPAHQVRVEADERVVVGIVALYEGRLLGEYACPGHRPQMIRLAQGAGRIPTEEPGRQGEVQRLA